MTKLASIQKTIEISAPKEMVWEVLTKDEFTRIWYEEFSEGSHADTDWKEGSKALFTDHSNCGMVARVIRNKYAEELVLEFQGIVMNGKEEYDTPEAKVFKGGIESYKLSEKEGKTTLSIHSDMSVEYFESMSLAWVKALKKLKGLAEGKSEKVK